MGPNQFFFHIGKMHRIKVIWNLEKHYSSLIHTFLVSIEVPESQGSSSGLWLPA